MNRLYFALASLLFLISCYQVNISATVLERNLKALPQQLTSAFEAGCTTITKSKKDCKDAVSSYRSEVFNLYRP